MSNVIVIDGAVAVDASGNVFTDANGTACCCDAGDAIGPCCIEDLPCLDNTTQQQCVAAGGLWHGPSPPNPTCLEDPKLCVAEEACCLPDGTCIQATPLQCVRTHNGTPQGPGTVCQDVNCPFTPACLVEDCLTCPPTMLAMIQTNFIVRLNCTPDQVFRAPSGVPIPITQVGPCDWLGSTTQPGGCVPLVGCEPLSAYEWTLTVRMGLSCHPKPGLSVWSVVAKVDFFAQINPACLGGGESCSIGTFNCGATQSWPGPGETMPCRPPQPFAINPACDCGPNFGCDCSDQDIDAGGGIQTVTVS